MANVSVSIGSTAFSPAQVKVKAGDSVTWTNNDTVPHTVTFDDGSPGSGELAAGATFNKTFTAVGTTNKYHCDHVATMTGVVGVN